MNIDRVSTPTLIEPGLPGTDPAPPDPFPPDPAPPDPAPPDPGTPYPVPDPGVPYPVPEPDPVPPLTPIDAESVVDRLRGRCVDKRRRRV